MKKITIMLLASVLMVQALTLEHKRVQEQDFQKIVRLGGTLQSLNEQYVSTRTSGYIERLHVRIGDEVKEGQLLASIDPIEGESIVLSSKANLEQAKASLEQAKATFLQAESEAKSATIQAVDAKNNYQRYAALYKEAVISKRDYEQAELSMQVKSRAAKAANQRALQAQSAIAAVQASVKALEVGVKQSQNAAGYFALTAKFDGIITEQLKEEHELVSPGEPIVHMASLSPLKLSLNVPTSIFSSLKTGQEIQLLSSQLKTPKSAILKAKVPFAKEGVHSYEIRLETSDDGLLPGMYVEAIIPIENRRFISLEPSMIAFRGGITGVFIIENLRVAFVPVDIQITEADRLGVVGLKAQQEVVMYPPLNLQHGMELTHE